MFINHPQLRVVCFNHVFCSHDADIDNPNSLA